MNRTCWPRTRTTCWFPLFEPPLPAWMVGRTRVAAPGKSPGRPDSRCRTRWTRTSSGRSSLASVRGRSRTRRHGFPAWEAYSNIRTWRVKRNARSVRKASWPGAGASLYLCVATFESPCATLPCVMRVPVVVCRPDVHKGRVVSQGQHAKAKPV